MKVINESTNYEAIRFEFLECGTFFTTSLAKTVYFKPFENPEYLAKDSKYEIFWLDSKGINKTFIKNSELVRPVDIKTIKFKFRKKAKTKNHQTEE